MSTCQDARELLSAALDGEADLDAAPERVRRHLAECAECARWSDQAAHLNRLLRVSPVADDDPGLADAVLAQVRLPRVGRWRPLLRVALALVAIAQLAIGLTSLFHPVGMPAMAMPDTAHLDHEEAAFNIAFGIALATVAWNGRRAAAQLPVLAAFVLILAVSSAFDLLDGNVTWPRLVTHLPVVLGLLLSAAVGRGMTSAPGPRTDAWRPRRSRRPGAELASLRRAETEPARRDRPARPPAARRDVA